MIDAELASGIVVGLYDAGKREVYGFGKGPGRQAPDRHTLFEIGSITKVYTSLLFADAVQRREVALDTPVAELLPPGVTVPTPDKHAITLGQLALHTSGLPRLPPSIAAHAGAARSVRAATARMRSTPISFSTALDARARHAHRVLELRRRPARLRARPQARRRLRERARDARARRRSGSRHVPRRFPRSPPARRATGTNDDLAPVP